MKKNGVKKKILEEGEKRKKGKRKKEAEWNVGKYTFCFLIIQFLSFSGFCKLFSTFQTLKGGSTESIPIVPNSSSDQF
jgi:hypothetical protein